MLPELFSERLCASGAAQAELVLLHGWGSSRECWRAMLPSLREWANVTLLELPGLGAMGPVGTSDELASRIVAACPPDAVLVGWSLGGQLATLAAARAPERICALVTLASNPHFTAVNDWPGVESASLQQMIRAQRAHPLRNTVRFEALQAQGQTDASGLRQRLAACRGEPAQCLAGLEWLAGLDTRAALTGLHQPQLHLLGAADTLLPPELEPALAELLSDSTRAHIERRPRAGHALPLQCPAPVAGRLRAFLAQSSLLLAPEASRQAFDKRAVAASFGRAAASYDSVAALQQDVGQRLLAQIPEMQAEVSTVVDLGCGTGYFQGELAQRFPEAQYVGLDLATGMLEYARRERDLPGCWVAGDAEQLPLATGSVDLVFSSLAIQWCQRPAALLAELGRVLRPGGVCVFSTLGPATLHELRSAWAAVDQQRHVNDFLPAAALEQAAAGQQLRLDQESLCLRYRDLRELFTALKGIGAHNVHSDRSTGLGGRRALTGMMAAYEQFREQGYLPATYEVYYGVLQKPAHNACEEAA